MPAEGGNHCPTRKALFLQDTVFQHSSLHPMPAPYMHNFCVFFVVFAFCASLDNEDRGQTYDGVNMALSNPPAPIEAPNFPFPDACCINKEDGKSSA
eukprot:1148771-Pelagomonas_calceolata.AAC.5